jgi:ATP-dependent DNA helicase HFM1/MER3
VLVNEATADLPSDKLDFSMRKEVDVICDSGRRVAIALGQLCVYKQYLAPSVHALVLAKCLHVRLWEESSYVCRQLKGIGPKAAQLLVSAGITLGVVKM